ncbi:MAG: ATP phosphoribosyltransferase regulatory subunit, partial [Candidatus Pacebacteria bacterium]|nr:ATP phosphoribosyltransferase regulatory subunit [Candidatus Paceibacterota bacterium]
MEKMKFQSVTGMHDILPETQKYFKKIYETVSIIADFYNFGKIDTPLLESAELFSKGVGENTDIVEKEMYTLKTKKGEVLALRPEWTAPIGRAYIEHGMHNRPQPLKLWYFGPCFRHENPQAGRYRQFWQFGFEIFGEKEAIVDAQIIQIFYNILKELKIKDVVVD